MAVEVPAKICIVF